MADLKSDHQFLSKFLRKTRLSLVLFAVLEKLFLLILLGAVAAIVMNILEVLGIFYGVTRLVFIIAVAILFGATIIWGAISSLARVWSLQAVAIYTEKRLSLRHNEIVNALELAPQVISSDRSSLTFSHSLVIQLVSQIVLFLKSKSPLLVPEKRGVKENARYLAISLIGLIFLVVLQPSYFRQSLSHLMTDSAPWLEAVNIKVITGNKTALKGQELTIEAEIDSKSTQEVRVYYSSAEILPLSEKKASPKDGPSQTKSSVFPEIEKWPNLLMELSTAASGETMEKTEIKEEQGRLFKKTFTPEKSFTYRVSAAGSISPAFYIKVAEPPEVGDIFLSYNYPQYSGKEPKKEGPVPGDIAALKGTAVEIKSRVNKRVSKAGLVINNSQRMGMEIGQGEEITGELILMEQGEYTIEVVDSDGIANVKPIHHTISLEEDLAPKIQIDQPGKDITVNNLEIVPIEYTAEDDFGLREVILHYEKDGREEKEMVLRLGSNDLFYQGRYNWNLAALNLKPGEPVSYFLEITDNDQISGPKSGFSETYYLTIYSQEEKRKELLATQDEILRDLLHVLGDQLEVQERTQSSQFGGIGEVLEQQDEILQKTSQVVEKLEALLLAMNDEKEYDSLNYYELESLVINLRRVRDYQMSQLREVVLKEGVEAGTKDLLARQKEIVVELEKDILFLYSLIKRARLEDIYRLGEELLDRQMSLLEKLQELKNSDSKDLLEALKKELDKLQELLASMAAQMSKLMLNIPQDFLNSEALKGMKLDDLSKQMEELKDALASGNLDEALAKAEQLMSTLAKMLSSFREYASGSPLFEMSELMQGTQEMLNDLEQVIAEETALNRETEKMEDIFRDKQEKIAQGKIQKFLQYIQKKLTELSQHLQNSQTAMGKPDNRQRGLIGLFNQAFQQLNQAMLSLNPFSPSDFQKKGQELLKHLQRFETAVDQTMQRMPNKNANEAKSVEELKEGEKIAEEIWGNEEAITANPNEFLSPEELKKFGEMADRQGQIGGKTQQIQNKMGQLSKLSPFFGEGLGNNLKEAQRSMKSAQGELGIPDPSGAASDEREALQHLRNARDGLNEAAQKMAMGRLPSFIPGSRPMSGYRQNGRMGVAKGDVQIPGPGKEKGPREFREEILRAMQEGFPEAYEKLIREYYKSITK
ncbi:MAG: hypothetical protein HY730_08535 [Candidatus Tectomicrobia bacterium]|uniref:DUF4175 family protein n=1 Tax=Tectimicrobiota bacterium TaxID=2528274 RepID=A0A933GM27_UNCTE|nr:hypothetical protein [Candidatus Tectomicrobia bacterium]